MQQFCNTDKELACSVVKNHSKKIKTFFFFVIIQNSYSYINVILHIQNFHLL